ncbi:MAG: leucine-rich repeat domain-containing protein [Treponemataceae bacterium]|nr:leucine-rich repeat domain-containing protein [Treponemataceae bacterium]MDE7391226.1 leucine-rich repeat domain-containing protein [Treponemataceae bacterium]
MKKTLFAVIAALTMTAIFAKSNDSMEYLKIEGKVVMGVKDPEKVPAHIVIPNGIVEISNGAFERCTFLENITIPGSVKVIGYCTFLSCKSLKSVTILDGVETIVGASFLDCTSLTSITIPVSVKEIGWALDGGSAFTGCESLTEVNYGGTRKQWTEIDGKERVARDSGRVTVHCKDGDYIQKYNN